MAALAATAAMSTLAAAVGGAAAAQPGTSSGASSGAAVPVAPSPSPSLAATSSILREANGAAQLGDWAEVERLTAPLGAPAARAGLAAADAAELHRLLGLAFFFTGRLALAESELWAYLQLDLDAHLDPATVPPEAITFFESIAAKHRAELRALREARAPKPPPRRSLVLAFVPVASQVQNGHRTKAWVYGVSLGAMAVANVSSYLVLRRWCREGDGTCDRTGVDHTSGAKTLSTMNVISGVGFLSITALAVIDGLRGYRQAPTAAGAPSTTSMAPSAAPSVAPIIAPSTVGLRVEGSF